jgi:DivIVA domain-containing protein
MDRPPSSNQASSLDSLRTVEFRQTLRGYHIDDVDEYLERVAVEADALQEQLRAGNERLKQAAERIAQLEQLAKERPQPQPEPQPDIQPMADDSLQRTLILAQKFVDQTQAEARAQARQMVAQAEARAQTMVSEAEAKARSLAEDSEHQVREEVSRLEALRSQLSGDVEMLARHLDGERNRIQSVLAGMVSWIDEHLQPSSGLMATAEATVASEPASVGGEPSEEPSSHGLDSTQAQSAGSLSSDGSVSGAGSLSSAQQAGSAMQQGSAVSPGDVGTSSRPLEQPLGVNHVGAAQR